MGDAFSFLVGCGEQHWGADGAEGMGGAEWWQEVSLWQQG